MVKLFCTDIKYINDKEFTLLLKKLEKDRAEKCMSFLQKKDRLLCLFSFLLLKYALKEVGCSQIPPILKSSYGKPYFKDIGLFFNISHSGKYAVVAVGDEECGVDIEKIEKTDIKPFKICFTKEQWVKIANSQNTVEEFYKYWTLKESFLKLMGKGFFMDVNSFSYNDCSIEMGGINCFYRHFNSFPQYSLCCCCLSGNINDDISVVKYKDIVI